MSQLSSWPVTVGDFSLKKKTEYIEYNTYTVYTYIYYTYIHTLYVYIIYKKQRPKSVATKMDTQAASRHSFHKGYEYSCLHKAALAANFAEYKSDLLPIIWPKLHYSPLLSYQMLNQNLLKAIHKFVFFFKFFQTILQWKPTQTYDLYLQNFLGRDQVCQHLGILRMELPSRRHRGRPRTTHIWKKVKLVGAKRYYMSITLTKPWHFIPIFFSIIVAQSLMTSKFRS